MSLRTAIADELKTALRAGDGLRVSTVRLMLARLKDADIAARPKGTGEIAEPEIVALLRGMVKSRRESVALYTQGNRPELAAKEEAEIAVIEGFLPPEMDETAFAAAIDAAIAETGAASARDMGRVMAALKAAYAGAIDLGKAGAAVRARLNG